MKFSIHVVLLISICIPMLISCSEKKDPGPNVSPVQEPVASGPPATTDSTQAGALLEHKILPHETDSLIRKTDEPHYAFLNTTLPRRNKLLLFLGGTNTSPQYFLEFSKTAAGMGFHVINVQYMNSVTARVCEDVADMKCFNAYHEEVIFGKDDSEFIKVGPGDGIINRAVRLLHYLHDKSPDEGWNQFYSDDILNWSAITVAGHSQGGDHAAYLAYKFSVDRLIMMCAPNDFSKRYAKSAAWCREQFATPANRFYGIMHKRDEVVSPAEHYAVWKDMNLLAEADTSSADVDTYKNFRALYTDVEPNPAADRYKSRHNAPVIDEAVPTGSEGEQLRMVWRHLLGAANR